MMNRLLTSQLEQTQPLAFSHEPNSIYGDYTVPTQMVVQACVHVHIVVLVHMEMQMTLPAHLEDL